MKCKIYASMLLLNYFTTWMQYSHIILKIIYITINNSPEPSSPMSGRGKGGKGLGASAISDEVDVQEFENQSDIINRLKAWVKTNGDDFLTTYKNKMADRSIDEGAKRRYIEEQKKQGDPLANNILRNLLDSIKHVSLDKMLTSMKKLSTEFVTKMGGKGFYIVLRPDVVYTSHTPMSSSNFITVVLHMILNPEFNSLLQGIIIKDKSISGEYFHTDSRGPMTFLYVDDVAFPTKTTSNNIQEIGKHLFKSGDRLHVLIPCLSRNEESNISQIERFLKFMFDDFEFFLYSDKDTSMQPVLLSDMAWFRRLIGGKMLQDIKDEDARRLFPVIDRLFLFLYGAHGFSKNTLTTSRFKKFILKPLFYTDMGMPGIRSTFLTLFFNTKIFFEYPEVSNDEELPSFNESIISGCKGETQIVYNNEDNSTPYEKNVGVCIKRFNRVDEWEEAMGNIRDTDPSGKSTKRDRLQRADSEDESIAEMMQNQRRNETIGQVRSRIYKRQVGDDETLLEIKERLYKGPGSEDRVMGEIRKRIFGSWSIEEKPMEAIRQALFGRDAKRARGDTDIDMDDMMLAFG